MTIETVRCTPKQHIADTVSTKPFTQSATRYSAIAIRFAFRFPLPVTIMLAMLSMLIPWQAYAYIEPHYDIATELHRYPEASVSQDATVASHQSAISSIDSVNDTEKEGTDTLAEETASDEDAVIRVNPLLQPNDATVAYHYQYVGLANLEYQQAPQGGGIIQLSLADQNIAIDIQRQGNKIVARLPQATLPSHLVRQHQIVGGLVSSILARNIGKDGVVTIEVGADFEYQAYQAGPQVNITVKPIQPLQAPKTVDKTYTGERISIDFQNVEVRNALHLLSQFTQLNIVASDSVSGSIMLNLINVPWDQALDIILMSKNLGQRKHGDVILVAPLVEIAEQEARLHASQQLSMDTMPLRSEYIRLNYAKAEDVLRIISQASQTPSAQTLNAQTPSAQTSSAQISATSNDSIDKASNQSAVTLLSRRGVVTIDARTNTLIIKDTANSIQNIRALIDQIDIPVRQVMIEVRIVSATDSFSKQLGVKWGVLSSGVATNDDLLVGGSDQTLADLKDFSVRNTAYQGETISYPDYSISRPDNLNVDLGISNAAGRMAFSILSMSDLMIDLELSAMQAEGQGEVISTPKILTMDKQKARVSSGTKIPYLSESEGGATTTQFEEAVLSLEVTPNITPEGKISLQLYIENGRPNPMSNGVILIDTDTLSTNVIIEDGQTIVLGGIYRNQIFDNVEKVPFFGDIPYVGRLFKKDIRRNDKQELLIFVTPKLIHDGLI